MQLSDVPIPVVDLFAGPGGLGEGFSSLNNGDSFKILVSAEMESAAHQTLKLRAFYRILKKFGSSSLDSYYRFCSGETQNPWDEDTLWAWTEAGREARQITLGTDAGNQEVNGILDASRLGKDSPWVLIGGPPCQAYSLVGRARNKGKADYRPEQDHRHFLYREYLRIIHIYQPSVFVMENVKGILSSTVNNQFIFHNILRDLSDPDRAFSQRSGTSYRIHSLTVPTVYKRDMSPNDIDIHDFVVRAEDYGVPQARHRVILVGIREDIARDDCDLLLKKSEAVTVKSALLKLPELRSRVSKGRDSSDDWYALVNRYVSELSKAASEREELGTLTKELQKIQGGPPEGLMPGALRQFDFDFCPLPDTEIGLWCRDERLKVLLNHESRSHMASDLRRYLYAAVFARAFKRSPKGHTAFDLPGLRPKHKNWDSGKFSDRFKVQLEDRPATTITSHISKDGHYFIHPDPLQCRSLTVREAARIQTFPDNYFFQGNRTQQFQQVGNAVPPLLAHKIAALVSNVLGQNALGLQE